MCKQIGYTEINNNSCQDIILIIHTQTVSKLRYSYLDFIFISKHLILCKRDLIWIEKQTSTSYSLFLAANPFDHNILDSKASSNADIFK